MKKLDPLDPHAIAQEVACELDRQYFHDHPNDKTYQRPPIPNEFPPHVYRDGEEIIYVMVTQIFQGCRSRVPVYRKVLPKISISRKKFVLKRK